MKPQKCERHFATPECWLIAVGRGDTLWIKSPPSSQTIWFCIFTSEGGLQHSPWWEMCSGRNRSKNHPRGCLQTFHLHGQSQERTQMWLLLHWPWSSCDRHLSLQGHLHSRLPSLILLHFSPPTIQCLQILFQLPLHVKRTEDQD